jgi:hypothetical protein
MTSSYQDMTAAMCEAHDGYSVKPHVVTPRRIAL